MSGAMRDRALIVLVCGLCYINFGGGAFHYDDFHSLVENPHIRSLANLPAFSPIPRPFPPTRRRRCIVPYCW